MPLERDENSNGSHGFTIAILILANVVISISFATALIGLW